MIVVAKNTSEVTPEFVENLASELMSKAMVEKLSGDVEMHLGASKAVIDKFTQDWVPFLRVPLAKGNSESGVEMGWKTEYGKIYFKEVKDLPEFVVLGIATEKTYHYRLSHKAILATEAFVLGSEDGKPLRTFTFKEMLEGKDL